MSAPNYPTRADANPARRTESSVARVEANRANSQFSTGPRTEAGKAVVSTNAVRHGLTANLQRLDPRDAPTYQQDLADLTSGLAPANPTEQFLIRDLAMLKARLDRVEAAEYAALLTTMDGDQNIDEASAYLVTAPSLLALEKTERFLRRNYMQTWSRLERMQRERKNEERESKQVATETAGTKQSQTGLTRSKQQPTTNSAVGQTVQPTPNLTSPILGPAVTNGLADETKANAA